MKRIYLPPRPHDGHGAPPEGGIPDTYLVAADLNIADWMLTLHNGTGPDALVEPPVVVDLSPLAGVFFDTDTRLASAILDPLTGILTLGMVDIEGNVITPAVTVNLSTLVPATLPTAGGATVSLLGAQVLPLAAIPTDINFADTEMVVTNDLDGTVSVSLRAIGTGPIKKIRRPIVVKNISFTPALLEEGYAVHVEASTDQIVTIPLESTLSLPVGYEIELVRMGTGAVSIDAVVGVVLNGIDDGLTTITDRYKSAILRKIATNTWLVVGSVAAVTLPVSTITFLWADVFADHTLAGGLDWRTWGTAALTPADVPLQWFMKNKLTALAPLGATIDLNSPTGTMYFGDRMTPPPSSLAKNWTLDLSGNTIQRGKTGQNWGQLNLWGALVTDSTVASEPSVLTTAAINTSTLVLKNDADTTAFMAAVGPGSIVEVRTNATAPGYHPIDSRTTIFIASKNVTTRTLTLSMPLEMTIPASNPLDYVGETSDPSTLKLLVGSLLSANATAGATAISVTNASQFSPGDWINISTIETPSPGNCQFLDGVGTDDFIVDITQDFGSTPTQFNEELHQIASITGSTLNLTSALGKNKLTAWKASVVKVDPLIGCTVIGGSWVGALDHGTANPWEHQYVWARYMVGCTIRDGFYDNDDTKSLLLRRMGQAIRLDTGDGNLVFNNTIGKGGGIEAGEAYGISLRLGERNSVLRANNIRGCRHNIEFWATSGGCIAEYNTTSEDTSSSIDTHGAWNTGITIQHNTITRTTSALYSSDSGGVTDAIRIGNNKFLFDEHIQVLNNVVHDYKGQALSIVPAARSVVVDGLDTDKVDRVIAITNNTRHPDLFCADIVIRNVQGDQIADRITEISHSVAGKKIIKGLTLKDFTIGATGVGTIDNGVERNIRVYDCNDVLFDNVRLEHVNSIVNQFASWFEDCTNVTITNYFQNGGARGIQIRNTTGVSGNAIVRNLTDTLSVAYIFRADNVNSGSLDITHNQGTTPTLIPGSMTITTHYVP